jgi:ribosomal protein L30E
MTKTTKDLDLSTGPSLASAATMVLEHNLLEEQRKKLVALGIPLCLPGSAGFETVKAIDKYISSKNNFIYTDDEKLPFNEKLGITTSRYEVWRSFYEDVLEGKPVKGDCDDFGMTALQLACIAGVPRSRLAQAIVVSETSWKDLKKPIKYENMDHFIGMYYHNKVWYTFGDTWGQDVIPSMAPANKRHRVMMMAILDEGILWRKFAQ